MGTMVSRPLKTMPDGRKYFVDYDGRRVFVKRPAPPVPPHTDDVRFMPSAELDVRRVQNFAEECLRNNCVTVSIRDILAHCGG